MRLYLHQAEANCNEAVLEVLDIIDKPPVDRLGVDKYRTDLFEPISKLAQQIDLIGQIAGDILLSPYREVRRLHKQIGEKCEKLTSVIDPLLFTHHAEKLLEPLNDLQDLLQQMEETRFEHSNMRRY